MRAGRRLPVVARVALQGDVVVFVTQYPGALPK